MFSSPEIRAVVQAQRDRGRLNESHGCRDHPPDSNGLPLVPMCAREHYAHASPQRSSAANCESFFETSSPATIAAAVVSGNKAMTMFAASSA